MATNKVFLDLVPHRTLWNLVQCLCDYPIYIWLEKLLFFLFPRLFFSFLYVFSAISSSLFPSGFQLSPCLPSTEDLRIVSSKRESYILFETFSKGILWGAVMSADRWVKEILLYWSKWWRYDIQAVNLLIHTRAYWILHEILFLNQNLAITVVRLFISLIFAHQLISSLITSNESIYTETTQIKHTVSQGENKNEYMWNHFNRSVDAAAIGCCETFLNQSQV